MAWLCMHVLADAAPGHRRYLQANSQHVTASACLHLCPEVGLRTAGSYGRALIDNDEASLGGVKGWQVGVAVAVTLVALLYMGRLAQQALDEAEQEEGAPP